MQARLGLLFLFLPFFFPPVLSSAWMGLAFSHPGSPLSWIRLTTGSHGPNRAGLLLRWCRFPTRLPKPHTGPHRGEFGFSLQNEFTPPPKGGGAGYRLSWVGRVGSVRSQLGHAGPTRAGFVASLVSFPYPALKTAHRRHTGPSLVFTVFSWYASFAEVPQAGAPGGNSPLREWAGSCKAASRFSQCRPMSTPLSAGFR